MTHSLDTTAAREMVAAALHAIVPDADLDTLDEHAPLREEFELDSLDFLTFVQQLSKRSGERIDEDDYPRLGTLAGCVNYLRNR